MKYYQVPPELDGKVVTYHKNGKRGFFFSLYCGELFTFNECKKYNINYTALNEVIISKFKTYWFFGKRFM